MKVNIFGFIDKALGLGQSARISLDAFHLSGIPCTATNIPRHDHLMNIGANHYIQYITENPDAPINLIHMNPDCLDQFYKKSEDNIFNGKYNIGFWFWETDIVPSQWHYAYDLVDEIWVASDFNHALFSQSCDLPVIKMPTAIEVKPSLTSDQAKAFFNLSGKFVFLSCFDFNSSLKRKNPQGVIEAFQKAFPDNNNVCLVFKTQHAAGREDRDALEFRKLISEDSRIISIDQAMTTLEMANLKNACDCYVSLHRSEGFGLNIAESMALGKPVIATHYSGNLDFTKPNNSYLVDYKIISMQPGDYYCATDSMHWAEPDLDHAIVHMKAVYSDFDRAIAVGEQSKQFMKIEFNREKVAIAYKKRIQEIMSMI